MIFLKDMNKYVASVSLIILVGVAYQRLALAEGQAPPQYQPNPGQPLAPSGGNNIKVFDDKVFDIGGGSNGPETRTSAGGNTRYLDKEKEYNTNTEQRNRYIRSCEKYKDISSEQFRNCVAGEQAKDTKDKGVFGVREPRSGSDGLNSPSKTPGGSAVPYKPSLIEPESESEMEGSSGDDE